MMTRFILIQSSEMTLAGGSGLPHISFWGLWEYAIFFAEGTKADSPSPIYVSVHITFTNSPLAKASGMAKFNISGTGKCILQTRHSTKVWGWSVLLQIERD